MNNNRLRALVQQDQKLNPTEKQEISSFFQEFIHSAKRAEIQKKKVQYQWLIIAMVSGIVILSLIRLFLGDSAYIIGEVHIGEILFVGIIGIGAIIGYLNKQLSSGFGPDFVQALFGDDIQYSTEEIYFCHLEEYKKNSGLLNPQIKYEKKEDSLHIQQPSYTLQALEYLSKKKSQYEKHNSVSNHAYIMRLKIHNHRFPISKRVMIQSDINTAGTHIYMKYSILTLLGGLLGGLLGFVIFSMTDVSKNLALFIGVLCGGVVGFLVAYCWEQSRMKKYVQLESIEFEKYFDVISDDPIESRKLLTPSMMENLVGLRKTGKKRELSFVEDTVYAKFDIKKSFLEIHFLFNSTKKFYKSVIDFYLAIKYMKDFAEYLNIDYFSATQKHQSSQ